MIKDYAAFTNASLRAAVKEYFADKAATERRHGKIGTWDVSRVTDMSKLFWGRKTFQADLSAWDTSSVVTMKAMLMNCHRFNCSIGSWDVCFCVKLNLGSSLGEMGAMCCLSTLVEDHTP